MKRENIRFPTEDLEPKKLYEDSPFLLTENLLPDMQSCQRSHFSEIENLEPDSPFELSPFLETENMRPGYEPEGKSHFSEMENLKRTYTRKEFPEILLVERAANFSEGEEFEISEQSSKIYSGNHDIIPNSCFERRLDNLLTLAESDYFHAIEEGRFQDKICELEERIDILETRKANYLNLKPKSYTVELPEEDAIMFITCSSPKSAREIADREIASFNAYA
jgi:hypothetical protein